MPKKTRRLESAELFSLLRRRTRLNSRQIDREIESRSVEDLVVLTSDSADFSRKAREYGIIEFLAVMTRCYDRLIPLIEKRGGVCLSHNADNILAVFDRPESAVRAALDMQRWCAQRNEYLPERECFSICIGINRGKLLRLEESVFGDVVNISCKIGEDVAVKDEILITAKVARGLKGFKLKPCRAAEFGGLAVKLFRVLG